MHIVIFRKMQTIISCLFSLISLVGEDFRLIYMHAYYRIDLACAATAVLHMLDAKKAASIVS